MSPIVSNFPITLEVESGEQNAFTSVLESTPTGAVPTFKVPIID